MQDITYCSNISNIFEQMVSNVEVINPAWYQTRCLFIKIISWHLAMCQLSIFGNYQLSSLSWLYNQNFQPPIHPVEYFQRSKLTRLASTSFSYYWGIRLMILVKWVNFNNSDRPIWKFSLNRYRYWYAHYNRCWYRYW